MDLSSPDGEQAGQSRLHRPGRWEVALILAGLLWGGFLIFIALEPRPPRVPGIGLQTASGIGHFTVFVIATGWIYLLIRGRLQLSAGVSVLLGVAFASSAGLALEIAQATLTDSRAFQWRDISANVSGSVVAAIALFLIDISGATLRRVSIAIVVASAVSVAGTLTVTALWNPEYPYEGDHWHAQYLVITCGTVYPSFPSFPGDIHSHGDRLIHIHPHTAESSGANANLARFFELAGGELTNTGIAVPGGPAYENGDSCDGDAGGELTLHRFDVRLRQRTGEISSPKDYVPRQSETLIVEFGTEPFDLSLDR